MDNSSNPTEPTLEDEPILPESPNPIEENNQKDEEAESPKEISSTSPDFTAPAETPITTAETQEPTPVVPETPNSTFPPQPASYENNEKKKSNIPLLIAIILAILGIGFGIYGIFFKPKEEKIIYKNSECPKCETSETESIADPNYIYIGEWGIKIKIPDTLKNVQYTYADNRLEISGIPSDYKVETDPYFIPNTDSIVFSNIDDTEEGPSSSSRAVKVFDKHGIFYHAPGGVINTEESSIELENKAHNLVMEMLTNPDNYSIF